MLATDAISAAATWRPQEFGDKRPATIADPIIEPLWTGPRILALVDGGSVRLSDANGAVIDGHEAIVEALRESVSGATVLVEAFLTPEPIRSAGSLATRDIVTVPKAGQAMTQMIIGARGDRKARLASHQEEARQRTIEGADDELALVAVDLLWLDDDLVSLRTFDVLRALDMAARWPGLDASDIRCYAFGRQGVYGRLAALLDPRIKRVAVVQAFEYGAWAESRYYDLHGIYSVLLNGVLLHFDLLELEQTDGGP